MPHIRKALAGSDSYGHQWPEAGAVVEVTAEQAAELLAIPDGGFSLVTDESPIVEEPAAEPTDSVEEPDPAAEQPVDEAPPPRQPRGRKPKATQ
jgi:hypothetical protein